jgi:hypothetical protein
MELLLQRRIGLASQQLDRPGLDELSVLDGEGDPRRRILPKGVLLAAASLLNGFDHPYLLRNDLLRADGPLKIEARLSDTLIREGLDVLLDYGFLVTPADKQLHLEFFIPVLGESLRAEFRTQWNDILNQLEELASTVYSLPARRSDASEGEAAELRERVGEFLQREIARYEANRREFLIAQVGVELQREFPGPPVYEWLGFPRLRDLLRSFDGFLVTGDPPREILCRATADDFRGVVIQQILGLIDRWETDGRHLTAAVLGNQLLMRFPESPVYQQLGYPRLIDLLNSIPEVIVEGAGLHRFIRRARPAGDVTLSEDSKAAVVQQPLLHSSRGLPLCEQVRAFLLELLDEAEMTSRVLTMGVAGIRLSQQFPGEGSVHQRLGFPRLTDLIQTLEGIRTNDLGGPNSTIFRI